MRILGIDLGSRAVKAVIFDENKPVSYKIFDTASFYRGYCKSSEGKLFVDFKALELGKTDFVVSTGYGRNNVNISGAEVITELKAHTFGALWQTGLTDFTLLDIGGQDSKVISVRNSKMQDMILNDKCAASCGRYLENMAVVLGLAPDEMEKHYLDPVELSSTCAVFGESELIGRMSEGSPVENLAAGVNYSLFKRIKPLIERFPGDILVITGGVAGNDALVNYIRKELDFNEVVIPENPQMNGAVGCCAYKIGKINR